MPIKQAIRKLGLARSSSTPQRNSLTIRFAWQSVEWYKGAVQEVKMEIPFCRLGVKPRFQARR